MLWPQQHSSTGILIHAILVVKLTASVYDGNKRIIGKLYLVNGIHSDSLQLIQGANISSKQRIFPLNVRPTVQTGMFHEVKGA